MEHGIQTLRPLYLYPLWILEGVGQLFRIKSAATPPTPPPHRPQYGHVTILYCTAL